MPKNPMNRERAIELIGKFMLLDGMSELDFFVCGSIRRGDPEVGDVDIIVVGDYPSKDKHSERFFESGGQKARTYSYYGRQINMWRSTPELFGSAVMYATGSGQFNRRLRVIAQRKGFKLSQNGLVDRKSGKLIVGASEKQIFNKLGLKYIPPGYRQSKRMSATLEAFTLRFKTDQSYVEPILGRVFDRSKYTNIQQPMLPERLPDFNIEQGLKNAKRLLGDKDA